MKLSKYNMKFGMENGKTLLLNPLFGTADIVDEEAIKALDGVKNKTGDSEKTKIFKKLTERGYILTDEDEEEILKKLYKESRDAVRKKALQITAVLSLACEFNCQRCDTKKAAFFVNSRQIDAVFSSIKAICRKNNFGSMPEITITGGEFLFMKKGGALLLDYFLKSALKVKCRIKVKASTYLLKEYFTRLEKIKNLTVEILLGTWESSVNPFISIRDEVEMALKNDWKIHFLLDVSKESIKHSYKLANYFLDTGWTFNRNNVYLPHLFLKSEKSCWIFKHSHQDHELLEQFFSLRENYPQIDFLETSGFCGMSYVKNLIINGELHLPHFCFCRVASNQFIFDPIGDIFVCVNATGEKKYRVGTYYPNLSFDESKVLLWQSRSMFTIPECKDCNKSLICAGGCAFEALSKKGILHTPHCQPVEEILSKVLIAHFDEFKDRIVLKEKGDGSEDSVDLASDRWHPL